MNNPLAEGVLMYFYDELYRTKSLPDYESIKRVNFVKQPTESWCRMVLWNIEKKNGKLARSQPMSACAHCAGWHGSIFFANALSPLFTEQDRINFFQNILDRQTNWSTKFIASSQGLFGTSWQYLFRTWTVDLFSLKIYHCLLQLTYWCFVLICSLTLYETISRFNDPEE